MSAVVFGLSANEIIPQPNFSAARSSSGQWTGSRTYKIRKQDKDSTIVLSKFERGKLVTDIGNDLSAYWNFLQVEDFEIEDNEGGLATISVQFAGVNEDDLSPESDREKVYSLRATLTERPIIEHPNYLKQVKYAGNVDDHTAYVAYYNKQAYANPPTGTNPEIRRIHDSAVIISQPASPDSAKWWGIIGIGGIRTFVLPHYEWTVSTSNVSGLSSNDLEKFGKKDTPEGNPPEPFGQEGDWLFIDATDERGTNGSSNSRTWRFYEGGLHSEIY